MRIRFILISLFICFNLILGQVNNNSTNNLELSDLGLYPYPTIKDLKQNVFDEKDIQTSPISFDDINENFSNIDDFEWLREISKQNKVILLGEHHYNRYIMHLRNRILFSINTYDYYSLLIMEEQYSMTPFANHYLTLNDDNEAEKYFNKVLHPMIGTREMYELFQHIRRWNTKNPQKIIKVGFSDIEHDFKTTMENIIVPYFKKINNGFSVDIGKYSYSDIGKYIPKFNELLQKANQMNLVGEFPFITTEYISNVIENINSTYKSYCIEDIYYRQKAIIRNITDPGFLGNYIINGKVMIHGGGYHTTTHVFYPDNTNFYREGSYLTYEFKPTKGKTYSIKINSYARSIGEMVEVDLDSCLQRGTGYNRMVQRLQKAYQNKLISKTDYVIDWKVNDFHKLILKNSIIKNNNPVLINHIEWEKIFNIAKDTDGELYKNIKKFYDEYSNYDTFIIVTQSPVTEARLKEIRVEK